MNKQNTASSMFIYLVVPCILKSLKMWETRDVCVCVCVYKNTEAVWNTVDIRAEGVICWQSHYQNRTFHSHCN